MISSFSQTTARSHARLVFFCCGVVHCSFVFSSEGKVHVLSRSYCACTWVRA